MLSSLTIKNILLIDLVELEFKTGLNTLTGETGVGKSVLLDCLGFALGWNKKSPSVREGAQSGEVTAEFLISTQSDLIKVLKEAGMPKSETIIIRRLINKSDGRKRNFVNDKNVSVDFIKRLSVKLIELQDQTGNQILLNEKSHLQFLDKFAGLGPMIIEIRKLWKEKEFLKKELDREIAHQESAELQKTYLKNAIEEMRLFDAQKGEEEALDLKRRQVRESKKNKEKFEKIDELMSLISLETDISDLIKLLDLTRQSLGDIVDESISALDKTLLEFTHARSEIDKLMERQNFDTFELENIEERLFKLKGLGRKYNVNPNDLPKLLDNMLVELEKANSDDNKVARLKKDLEKVSESYEEKSNNISTNRTNAAKNLDQIIMDELKHLKMADCRFLTQISPVKPSSSGVDDVVFKVATNQGSEFSKLQVISSGGEMSRFLLALKVCLTNQMQGTTMIFDEIDRGIGGATADSVGRRLAMLAKYGQIIVITHSPQVAAHGDHQWKVEKIQSKNTLPLTKITELKHQDRLIEIARMLAGKEISAEALAAAEKLLVKA